MPKTKRRLRVGEIFTMAGQYVVNPPGREHRHVWKPVSRWRYGVGSKVRESTCQTCGLTQLEREGLPFVVAR